MDRYNASAHLNISSTSLGMRIRSGREQSRCSRNGDTQRRWTSPSRKARVPSSCKSLKQPSRVASWWRDTDRVCGFVCQDCLGCRSARFSRSLSDNVADIEFGITQCRRRHWTIYSSTSPGNKLKTFHKRARISGRFLLNHCGTTRGRSDRELC